MPIYKPPHDLNSILWNKTSIFLAGSIEMGKATHWQKKAGELLSEQYIVLDPRRDDWDASWEQDINNPHFRVQVQWELDALERADKVLFYFEPGERSLRFQCLSLVYMLNLKRYL